MMEGNIDMNRTGWLLLVGILVFTFLPVSGNCGITLAVLDFENNGFYDTQTYQPLSKGLAQMMITEIQQIESIQVVERQRLQAILDELKLSQSGLLSEERSMQVGKMLGAKYLVFGGYLVGMDKKIRIDVRVVEVETGLTLKAEEQTGKVEKVLVLLKKLSKNLMQDIQVNLTREEEKRLKSASDVKADALLAFSTAVSYEDKQDYQNAVLFYKKAVDIDPDFDQARERMQRLSDKLR